MSRARDIANIGDDVATGEVVTTASPSLGRRNLIINGDFQVSQRGDYTTATSASNSAYYLDRWKTSAAGTGLTYTIQDIGRKVKLVCTGATTSGTMRIFQKLELGDIHINKFVGQQMTVSAKVKSNSSNCRVLVYHDGWTAGENAVHTGDGTEQTLSFTFDHDVVCSTEFSILIGIDGDASANVPVNVNDYFEVTEVQLEVGSVATPFEHRSYGEELALCQRYYFATVANDRIPAEFNNRGGSGINFCTVWHPVQMRTDPSITFADGDGNAAKWSYHTASVWSGRTNNLANNFTLSHPTHTHLASNSYTGYDAFIMNYTADAEL